MNIQERRREPRYDVAYPFEHKDGASGDVLFVENINRGGFSFVSPRQIPSRGEIKIGIFLKSRMFIVSAKVVYSIPKQDGNFTMGAAFTAVPEGFLEILDREIEEIGQLHLEKRRYYNKNVSFKEASIEYLGGVFSAE